MSTRFPEQRKLVEVQDDGAGPRKAKYRMACRRCGAKSTWLGAYGLAAHEAMLHRYRRC